MCPALDPQPAAGDTATLHSEVAGSDGTAGSEDTADGESTVKVGFNVLNTIVGSGIVCLPYALHNAGFVFGLVMLVVTAALSQFSLFALVAAGKRTGTAHFSSVTQAALGRTGYHLLNLSMVVDMVGTVILYLMILGDLATALVNIYLPFTISRASIVLGVSLFAILPLLFFRNTGPLARLSIVSILCLPYIIMAVALRAPHYAGRIKVEFPVFGPRILPAMGVIAFTFSSCHAAFPNYMGLRDRSTAVWVRASSFATVSAAAVSVAFAVAGYLSFGSKAQPNILANFPDSDGFVNVGRLLFALSLVLTVPMGFYPIRDTVTEMLKIDPERHGVDVVWESICTVVLFTVCAVSAALFTDLGLAYELIGVLSSSVVNFLLPALVFLWAGTDVSLARIVSQYRQVSCPDGELGRLIPAPGSNACSGKARLRDVGLWALAWTVAAFGVWVMVLGTYNIGRGM